MPMHYPPLADGTYRVGDSPQPLPSPAPGPDPTGPDPTGPGPADPNTARSNTAGPNGAGPSPGGPQTPQHHLEPGAPPGNSASGQTAAAAIVGGLALVVVVILGFALFGPGSDSDSGSGAGVGDPVRGPFPPQAELAPERLGALFDVEGHFTVMSSPGEPVSGDGSGCDLPISLSDLGEGTQITLSEGLSTIGSAFLAYERGDLSSCTFLFDFNDVPSGGSFYLIEIPGRGQLTYTEDELRAGVEITLGR